MSRNLQDEERLRLIREYLAATNRPEFQQAGISHVMQPRSEPQQVAQSPRLLPQQQPREAQPPLASGTDEVLQARQLEQQAQPRQERPTGLLGQLGRSALEGAAGLAHPGGYYGWQADRQQQERQRQQDLFTRAQALRSQAVQGQNAELAGRRLDIESQNADLDRQNLVSQIRSRDNPPPKFGYGANVGTYDERTGRVVTPPTDMTQPAEKNQGYRDKIVGTRTIRQYFNQSDPSKVTYQEDIGPAQMPSTPGAFQFMVNPAGQITAKGNTETGDITPVANPEGVRRNALPTEAQTKLTAFDAADQIINDIEKYSKKIHTKEGLEARGTGLVRRVKGYAGYDADVISLKSKAGELSQVIRALGESGALAEGDVGRGVNLIPIKPEYTDTEAKQMIGDLRNLVKSNRGNYEKRYGMSSGGGTGRIRVRNRETGQTGTISEGAFDPTKYERIQ